MPKDFIYVPVPDFALSESLFSDIENLNDRLNKIGVSFELSRSEKEYGYGSFVITVNQNRFDKATKRKAGRHPKYNFTSSYTYGDIRKWRTEGIPVSEIVKRLDVSRATFYRRMKYAEDWHYNDAERWTG